MHFSWILAYLLLPSTFIKPIQHSKEFMRLAKIQVVIFIAAVTALSVLSVVMRFVKPLLAAFKLHGIRQKEGLPEFGLRIQEPYNHREHFELEKLLMVVVGEIEVQYKQLDIRFTRRNCWTTQVDAEM